jgi:hypothetical protein
MSADRLDQLLEALPGGLDPALVAWLVSGVKAWREGDDLEAALELACGDAMTLDQRDELLRVVIDLSPGNSMAARCCSALDNLDGTRHPDELAAQLILRLRRSRIRLPGTVRHLRRIANGHRCEDSFC